MLHSLVNINLLYKIFEQFSIQNSKKVLFVTCTIKQDARDKIPAVTHVDYTSRVQTMTSKSNPFVYGILDEFEKLTEIPVIINTSLNFRGKPIVENPVEALGNFYSSGLDFLVIGNYFLEK